MNEEQQDDRATAPEDWRDVRLGELVTFEYGASLPAHSRSGSGFPVYGSNGVVGRHSSFLVDGPGIVVGRKGSVGEVTWSAEPFWPIDTTYYIELKEPTDLRWLYYALTFLPLQRLDSSTGVPGLNRHDAYELPLLIPPLREQEAIAEALDTVARMIAASHEKIAKLEQVQEGLKQDLLSGRLIHGSRVLQPASS